MTVAGGGGAQESEAGSGSMGERSRWLGLQLAELEVSDRGRHEAREI